MDRSNDVLLGNNPVQVLLTPPPNLKVEKIVVPTPSFSGTIVISTRRYSMKFWAIVWESFAYTLPWSVSAHNPIQD